jgi:hypothetical protein
MFGLENENLELEIRILLASIRCESENVSKLLDLRDRFKIQDLRYRFYLPYRCVMLK